MNSVIDTRKLRTQALINACVLTYLNKTNYDLYGLLEILEGIKDDDEALIPSKFDDFLKLLDVNTEGRQILTKYLEPRYDQKIVDEIETAIIATIDKYNNYADGEKDIARKQAITDLLYVIQKASKHPNILATSHTTRELKVVRSLEALDYFKEIVYSYIQKNTDNEILVVDNLPFNDIAIENNNSYTTEDLSVNAIFTSNGAYQDYFSLSNFKYPASYTGTYNDKTGELNAVNSTNLPKVAFVNAVHIMNKEPGLLKPKVITTLTDDPIINIIEALVDNLLQLGCTKIFLYCPKFLQTWMHEESGETDIESIITYNSKGETLYCISANKCENTLIANVQDYMDNKDSDEFIESLLTKTPVPGVSYIKSFGNEIERSRSWNSGRMTIRYQNIINNQDIYFPEPHDENASTDKLMSSIEGFMNELDGLKQYLDNL